MAQSRVEEDKTVKVRVIRRKVTGSVNRVEIIDDGTDLHAVAEPVFDYSAPGVRGCASRERKLGVAIGHCFGADEEDVQCSAGEEVGELVPDLAWKGGFGAGAEDEDPGWWGGETETFDARAGA